MRDYSDDENSEDDGIENPSDNYLHTFPERMRALALGIKLCNNDRGRLGEDLPDLIDSLLKQACEQVDYEESVLSL